MLHNDSCQAAHSQTVLPNEASRAQTGAEQPLPTKAPTLPAAESAKKLWEALQTVSALKEVLRSGWLRVGLPNPESVAAHSWGVAILALSLCPPSLDRSKVIEIALVHDWAEAQVGDLTPYDHVSPQDKAKREDMAFKQISELLSNGSLMYARFQEYQANATKEAQFVHALDKLDMALQAAAYAKEFPSLSFIEFIESAHNYLSQKLTEPEALALNHLLSCASSMPSEAAPEEGSFPSPISPECNK